MHQGIELLLLLVFLSFFNEFQKQGWEVPPFFTMGFDDYDHEALYKFSQLANTPFIHLQSIKDFETIYRYLATFQHERQLIELLVNAGDVRHFSIRLPLDGNAHASTVHIPFQSEDTLTINVKGREMHVRIKDPAKVPLATFNDKFNAIHSEALQIVADDKLYVTDKISALDRVRTKLNKVFEDVYWSSEEEQVYTELRQALLRYKEQLQQIHEKKDDALHQSLKSQAKHDLEYIEHPTDKHASSVMICEDGSEGPNCKGESLDNEKDDSQGHAAKPSEHSTGRNLLSLEESSPPTQTSAASGLTSPFLFASSALARSSESLGTRALPTTANEFVQTNGSAGFGANLMLGTVLFHVARKTCGWVAKQVFASEPSSESTSKFKY